MNRNKRRKSNEYLLEHLDQRDRARYRVWLLVASVWATRKGQTTDTETDRTMGHAFDGIEEYDNPLPKWWFYLFIATCVFALGYLALYPGLGNYKGLLGWTSTNQWEAEVAEADEKYGEIYAQYGNTAIPELAQDEDAMKIGQRLFANNCSVCHGTAARGQVGFPNLTDDDWLWGGEPDTILTTLHQGRNGNMPAKGTMPNMTSEQVDQVVNYVLSFSGREMDEEAAAKPASRCLHRPAWPVTVRTARATRLWALRTSPTIPGCTAPPTSGSRRPWLTVARTRCPHRVTGLPTIRSRSWLRTFTACPTESPGRDSVPGPVFSTLDLPPRGTKA